MTQQIHFWVFIQRNPKHQCEKTYAPLCSLQHYSQQPRCGSSPVSPHRQLGKDVVHVHNGMLLSCKPEGSLPMCDSMGGPRGHYTK